MGSHGFVSLGRLGALSTECVGGFGGSCWTEPVQIPTGEPPVPPRKVVVHKKYLPEEYVKMLDREPVGLEPWDPMGSLA